MPGINALLDGFERFKARQYPGGTREFASSLQTGLSPSVLIIACCDSVIDPTTLTDATPGDLLVIRNIASLVPIYHREQYGETQAALEFAVKHLKIEKIIILGHSQCTGIISLLDRVKIAGSPGGFLEQWTSIVEPAARLTLHNNPDLSIEEMACMCSKKALSTSLKNIETYPWIRKAIEAGKLETRGWFFDLDEGSLSELDRETREFIPFG